MKKVMLFLIMLVVLVGVYVLKISNVKVVADVKTKEENSIHSIDMESVEFQENYVDMRHVVDFSVTDTGIILYLEDGTGYYWEK